MANTVKLKRSAVQGKVPGTSDLELGELAINTYDGRLYLKKNDGTESIVEIGTHAAPEITEDLADTDLVPVFDASASVQKKSLLSRVWTYIKSKIAVESQLAFADGTASAPSITNTDDSNTGVFYPSSDTYAISTNGVERFRVDDSGRIGVGLTPTLMYSPDYGIIELGYPGNFILGFKNTDFQRVQLVVNMYPTNNRGSWKQLFDGPANMFSVDKANGFVWQNSSARAAGEGADVRLKMWLNNDGRLLVGTTDDNYGGLLQVNGSVRVGAGDASAPSIYTKLYPTTGIYFDDNAARVGISISGTTQLYVGDGNRVGIGTEAPTAKLDINSNKLRLRSSNTPASASAVGNVGEICWDSDFIYVCVATNTWKRAALATWS